jgi:hypothetical protein
VECPKCHNIIKDNETICPKCHKVLALECPNCHTLGDSAICQKCGYTILVKCSKCSKTNHIKNDICPKCKFPVKTSLAYQECESDSFASITVSFGALKKIRTSLKSQELYTKFLIKLKNLLLAQIKGVECKLITYGDIYVINMNKELSFPTSANKATRLALKIVNAFTELNANLQEELNTSLNLILTVTQKDAEQLQEFTTYENNVKPLITKKNKKKYLKGLQIILDQYVRDEIHKDYKTDSLYSIEHANSQLIFYEIILDSYVLPPNKNKEEVAAKATYTKINNEQVTEEPDKFDFKIFDINAKCQFTKTSSSKILDELNNNKSKIISIRANNELNVDISKLEQFYKKQDYRVLKTSCTEEMNYKPWGFFVSIFKDIHHLHINNLLNNPSEINPAVMKSFQSCFELLSSNPVKAMTPEDARYNYIETWNRMFKGLINTVIIVDGAENIDDTSLQTLELYFDKYKNIKPTFIFVTKSDATLHSKIKSLLRTPAYTEITLTKDGMDSCLSTLKSDATDFIQSFYFEKIKENFNGSILYFENAIKYLQETDILIEFENKLLVKNKKSIIIPNTLDELYKARIKKLSKEMDLSLILAYSVMLGSRLDFETLNQLGINEVEKHSSTIEEAGLGMVENGVLYINNYSILKPIIQNSLKKAAEEFLAKNIIAKLAKGIDTSTLAMMMGKLGAFREEYMTLWKNSVLSIRSGDYDAYLINCLGFLSLVEQIESKLSKEEIEENKKEVYNNILTSLYAYSPTKIYFLENILLMDAINNNDNEKIVKLSNLMLQGALISSNYTDAAQLINNILSRMPSPTLIVDGEINTKFLLLSLVNIEILYNIGDFRTCSDLTVEILKVLNPETLEKVKPASFSINLFISHILDTCRLAGFAKLYMLDDDLDDYFRLITSALETELPDKDAILAVRDFLCEKTYLTQDFETYSPFSKTIFLILQEFTEHNNDYKKFAQNIYQAKLLASDIHQREIELLCDLLIAFAYSKMGITQKAEIIYNDILETSERDSIFNIQIVAKYCLAQISPTEEKLVLLNDNLAQIQKTGNQAKILYSLCENLYIQTAKEENIDSIDIDSETQKLALYKDSLSRIINIDPIE